uniref:RING-type E3 ubiquitin transferase n=1 Tax=Pyramimonas obovata TaxID=1411642 RepID=A0A7S0MXU6_9CHLO|mmetsp:Transcript_16017/g.34806  ORF Transcript_16017/g.34806 Transcript_16017/m.34806 type:complete len:358 (+) Transcript_16017:157-1230(+)|eukprot:CAMPEP_0118951642 /NCGR_PEP_ID=MMETSP1169-20130426/53463_1 /TAXON_ID=36882 /ORGANISM="Pyramimonas obovata, Strain CCMP722" /LENGTH=357 /DNA_ID=CAMNT_0006898727 /DNA_START=71 /DNA_END=1144 /DNA_ORIENTATION=-
MSESAGQDSTSTPVCTFTGFNKKRRQRGNLRKKQDEEDDDTEGERSAVVRPSKAKKESALDFSSSNKGSHLEPGAVRDGTRFKVESSRLVQQNTDNGATRELMTETEKDRDARALREQVLKQEEGTYDPSVYKGMNNYKDYRAGFRRENTIASEKGTGSHGPMRANTTIRGTFIMDYKPDLCKDYKETGYCGYGDACKFMHDRGDYKSGWELDKEWEEKEKVRKQQEALKLLGEAEESDEEEDDLPFACFMCRENFANVRDPVVTKCKHYFCEHCALKHYAKSKLCFVCEEPTGGVFNIAQDILKKMKAQKAQGAQANPKGGQDGDDSGDEGGWGKPGKASASEVSAQGQSGGWVIP